MEEDNVYPAELHFMLFTTPSSAMQAKTQGQQF